jgi:WD40 repeat protein
VHGTFHRTLNERCGHPYANTEGKTDSIAAFKAFESNGSAEYDLLATSYTVARTIASASYDETVKLWDAASGAEQRALKGHLWSVNAVAFSPDRSYLKTNYGNLYLDNNEAHRDMNHKSS